MTPVIIIFISATMIATSFLSGIFGMAGGLVLVGVLLAIMPLPLAMALHAITQMASNGWRAMFWWRLVRWPIVGAYMIGCGGALLVWSVWLYVPSKGLALLLLGTLPFVNRLIPSDRRANPERFRDGVGYGALCMTLMLLTGVAGPILDQFFLTGGLDRRQIVATKGMCQLFGHGVKLLYFGAIIDQAAAVDPILAGVAIVASMIGTMLSKTVLERMSDTQYRCWGGRLITGISAYYAMHGTYLVVLA
ncbi:MAG: TSUP family transporter [Alphaproteobacteria bacterium]|nr:TSUP family transporter [Alphaproteobacteria bacterium]